MNPQGSTAPGPPGGVFYGWKIVGVAFVVDFIAVGFFFYSYGVFFKAIAAELEQGTRTEVSLGLTISGTVGALIAPFLGRGLDRRSIKAFMIAGTLFVSAGFGLLSIVTATWQFYLILGTLLGFGMSSMGGLTSSKLVVNWFEARRGRAFGLATVGVSLSGLMMPTIATWLVEHFGWRGGFRAYALLTLLIVTPLVLRYVVNRPEDMGLLPDGNGGEGDDPSLGTTRSERMWHTREIVRTGNFWAITLAFGLSFAALSAILTHLVPYATDLGISSYRAALVLSISAGCGAVGKLVFGLLVDRWDARYAIWLSFGMQLLGLLFLMQGGGYPQLLAAGAVFGFGMGGVVPLNGTVTGAAFGRLSFGKVTGLLRPTQVPIHMLGSPLAGFVYDRTGGYALAFQIFAGCYVVAALIAFALRVDRPSGSAAIAAEASASTGETGLA